MASKKQSSVTKEIEKFSDTALTSFGSENQKNNGFVELKAWKIFFLEQNLLPRLHLLKLRFGSTKAILMDQATVWKLEFPC